MARRGIVVNDTSESKNVNQLMDFEEAVKAFQREQKIKHRSVRTIKWQLECLTMLNKWMIENNLPTAPAKITSKSLKDYVFYLLDERHLSPATVNGRIMTFKSFFSYLHAEGLIKLNPNTLTKIKQRKNVIQAFSYDQIRVLLNAPDRKTFAGIRDYTVMLLLL